MSEYKSKFENKFEKYEQHLEKTREILTSVNSVGSFFRGANFWSDYIPVTDKKVNYLEIGTFHGANAITFALTYGKNEKSEIHCIDPWIDYDEYDEYKSKQTRNYSIFLKNLINSGVNNKFYVSRGFSNEIVPTLKDEYFDIIFIDGNHEPEYVLEDGVLSFRKLKKGGYMVFDDYGWNDTSIGIDSFVNAYNKYIEVIACVNCQLIIKKK